MRVVPLEPGHLLAFRPQPAQRHVAMSIGPALARALIDAGPAFTGLVNERPVVIAGCWEAAPQRGQAWALLAADMGPQLVAATRAVRAFLDRQEAWAVIETVVEVGYWRGARWARLLGFRWARGPVRDPELPRPVDWWRWARG
jgi:hypothetical protein